MNEKIKQCDPRKFLVTLYLMIFEFSVRILNIFGIYIIIFYSNLNVFPYDIGIKVLF